MITELHIQNFKSHKDTLLPFSSLNILTGLNGSGKSSVIQSLLLLRQSHKKRRLDMALELNKPFCNIGTGKDAIYQFTKDDFLRLSLQEEKDKYSWTFSASSSKDFSSMYLPLLEKEVTANIEDISLFNNNFQYLSAGRLPHLNYERDDFSVEQEKQISLENGYGELVAQFLYIYGNEKINNELKNANNPFDELKHQTSAWEREISPNVIIKAVKIGEDFTIRYFFEGSENEEPTDEFQSQNVGFGLSYALPIIVAILSAKKDALLLIENPEAHLHPYGQSKLAELIALASQSGVQIIIETHSDHIINGILVACKRFEKAQSGIDKNNVKMYYFGNKDKQHSSAFECIEILEGGKIDKQPSGFFDQTEKDLGVLMGF